MILLRTRCLTYNHHLSMCGAMTEQANVLSRAVELAQGTMGVGAKGILITEVKLTLTSSCASLRTHRRSTNIAMSLILISATPQFECNAHLELLLGHKSMRPLVDNVPRGQYAVNLDVLFHQHLEAVE